MSVLEHLPALLVIVPMMAAPVALLLRKPSWAWAWTMLVAVLVFVLALLLVQQVQREGVVEYSLGDWAAPLGIVYHIDALNGFIALLLAALFIAVVPYARISVLSEVPRERVHLFYSTLLLFLTGLIGITVTGDAFNVFVFMEIAALSSYALIGYGRDRRALPAAFSYLVMGTIGGTFVLTGVGLLYMATGSLNMADIAARLPEVAATRTVMAAGAFIAVGCGIKLALFPLHFWLPNAYTYAPSAVTIFMAATGTKVAAYTLLRFVYTVFGIDLIYNGMHFGAILLICAVVAMLVGSIVAIFQPNIKRMLAWSSVGQLGYIVAAYGLATHTGLTAGIVHLFNHALIKAALFMVVGAVVYRVGSAHIEAFAGLGRRMPWTMAGFVVAGFSLIGVPMTTGFTSKWTLILAAIEVGYWWLVAAVLISSLLAVVYLWRVVEVAYFRQPSLDAQVDKAPRLMLLPLWAVILTNVWLGLDTRFTLGLASDAASALLQVAQ